MMLRSTLEAHAAAVAHLEELTAVARTHAEGLRVASEQQIERGEALKLADGRAKLNEISATEVAEIEAEYTATVREARACTAACDILIPRIEEAQAAVRAAAAAVRGVAATEAAALLGKYLDEAHALAPHFAETVAMCFELDALSRSADELASGENAGPIGAPLYNVIASHGVGFRTGWHGTAYVGPSAGRRATMTPQALLALIENS